MKTMANENSANTPVTPIPPVPIEDIDLKAYAKRLVDMAPANTWSQRKHVAILAAIAIEHGLPQASKADIKASLLKHGVGGNASQFSQWLVKERLMTSATQALADEYDV